MRILTELIEKCSTSPCCSRNPCSTQPNTYHLVRNVDSRGRKKTDTPFWTGAGVFLFEFGEKRGSDMMDSAEKNF